MTIIVSFKHAGRVYLGSDSVASEGDNVFPRRDEKLILKNNMLFGITGSWRLLDIVRFSFAPPVNENLLETREFVSTILIDELIKCLKEKAVLITNTDGQTEMDSQILLAVEGRCFSIGEDFQVGESVHDFDAVGCADIIALGALNILSEYETCPETIILKALAVCGAYNGMVRGPFRIMVL